MKFKERLLQGKLVKRYKRFFVDIEYKNEIITAHCPNSGSMMGLLNINNNVWFSTSNNPKRKLKYTLEIIEINKKLVGINTMLTNKIVLEALNEKKIKNLVNFNNLKTEVKFSTNTRFDFMISNKKDKCFLEVKNVTLSRKVNIAEFPDAITSRGKKHLEELIKAKSRGYESFMLFLIQRNDCDNFKISEDIDPLYYAALNKAKKYGVKMLCYDCKINNKEVILNKKINFLK